MILLASSFEYYEIRSSGWNWGECIHSSLSESVEKLRLSITLVSIGGGMRWRVKKMVTYELL